MFRRFVTAVDTRPFSMAVATVGTTTMTGVFLLKATSSSPYMQERRPLTTKEAHFRAMLENAKESTWRENLETAAMAQSQNMMMNWGEADQVEVSKFVNKINARTEELLQQDREYWQKKEEYEKQQSIFATTTIW